jgi:hypothetical protein
MLDHLIVFNLIAHALQAAILYLDTRGWLSGGEAVARWCLGLSRRPWIRRAARWGIDKAPLEHQES